ncbi:MULTISPECIES: Ig-like domain-containing protein [Caloramator]|uniref:Ig-like domain (Group 2) n=1 Tax=Caloramator proteoclasticus DSM 10124 TaxID=1121262 RepID=A0A1M4S716_9CLOT|nr:MULTISPECIES: Ig-like domain-containing protein [Caloramator]SHE27817.1 Ig-like domain (group 2) [Caloramator proteoclasticus DSM 10124]
MSKKRISLIVLVIYFVFINNNAIALNKEPSVLWQSIDGGKSFERYNSIKRTNDSGFVVVGHTSSNDYETSLNLYGGFDALLAKYNELGKLEWAKTFGGEAFETFNSVSLCRDGGFIVSGFTESQKGDLSGLNVKGEEALIIKYDYNGNVEWKMTYGGSMYDRFTNAIEVADGYIAVGYSNSLDGHLYSFNKGEYDGIIVKLDRTGKIIWEKTFGGSKWDKFFSVIGVSDGYIVSGYSGSKDNDLKNIKIKGGDDGILVKYNSNGQVMWIKNIGGSGDETIQSICNFNNGFIGVGYTTSADGDFYGLKNKGLTDAFIFRFDLNGNILWKNTFGGTGKDVFNSVMYEQDFGIVAVGYSQSNDGDLYNLNLGSQDALAVKYNINGNMEWKKTYGKGGDDVFFSAVYSDFLGFVAAGYTNSKDLNIKGNEDCLIVKYEEPRVKVKGIYLTEKQKVIKKGESYKLTVRFIPDDSTIKKVKWTSSNSNIVTVDENGVIKAKYIGEAVITAKSLDGGYEAKCKIIVKHNFDKKKLPFIIWANLYLKTVNILKSIM